MQKVKINKTELRQVVQENRDRHRDVFERALEAYRAEVIKVLEQRLTAARIGEKIDVRIALLEPEDHTDEYDQVLRMLDMSVDDEIELTHGEFSQYVMDEWGWRRAWLANTAAYVVDER